MNKETKTDMKSKVMTGASTAVGATIGVVAGNIAATEVQAAETPGVTGGARATVTPADLNTHDEGNNVIEPTPEPSGPINPESPENPENMDETPEIIVTDYGTITNDDGSQMDVAVVSVDGQDAYLVDVNQDGTADVLFADVNNDGQIDNNEILDIESEGIYMASFQNEIMNDNTLVADNDYVNDANVDDYMA